MWALYCIVTEIRVERIYCDKCRFFWWWKAMNNKSFRELAHVIYLQTSRERAREIGARGRGTFIVSALLCKCVLTQFSPQPKIFTYLLNFVPLIHIVCGYVCVCVSLFMRKTVLFSVHRLRKIFILQIWIFDFRYHISLSLCIAAWILSSCELRAKNRNLQLFIIENIIGRCSASVT